jgi:hypothetical protein
LFFPVHGCVLDSLAGTKPSWQGEFVCARVGNQRSRGVVIAQVRTDAVQSLHRQRRDLSQSTYSYLSEDRDSSYYQVVSDVGFSMRYTCVSFSLFPVFIPRSTEKGKKINIFRCPITLRATNFILVTLLSLCPSWLSLVLVRFVFLVLVFCSVLYLCRSPIPPCQITNRSTTLIGLPSLAALRELSLRQP